MERGLRNFCTTQLHRLPEELDLPAHRIYSAWAAWQAAELDQIDALKKAE